MEIQRAIDYVTQHGTPLERARLAALTEGAPAPPAQLEPLLALQNQDAGWPLFLQPGLPSALNATCLVLGWLAELDELEQPACRRALDFIAGRQSPRGLWREGRELQVHNPPLWMDPESPEADVYTTALCASTLVTLSDEHQLEADRATSWLQSQVARDGLLPGFRLHSTWLALPAMARIVGFKSKTTRRMVIGLAQQLSSAWEGSMVAWMLNSLLDAGYRSTTQLVERAAELLGELQRPDGSWSSEEQGDEVAATIQALRAARRLGLR